MWQKINFLDLLKSRRGVSLVEMLITVFIFSILVGGIYTALNAGSNSWEYNKIKIELQQNLRLAQDNMREDLRKASTTSIVDVPADGSWYTSIMFRVPGSVDSNGVVTWPTETIEYLLDGASPVTLKRQIEEDTVITAERIVTENVNSLQIRRLTSEPNIVEIQLQATKSVKGGNSISANADFKIQLRN